MASLNVNIDKIWENFERDVFIRHFTYSNFCNKVIENMIREAIKNGETSADNINDNFNDRFIASIVNVTHPDYTEDDNNLASSKFDIDSYSYIDDFFGDNLNKHLSDKIKLANIDGDLDKLYKLTHRLWNEQKIILLNNTSCCGTCSWGEVRRTYNEYKPYGVKGVIGWWDQNDMMPTPNGVCIIGIWEDNNDLNDDTMIKNINFKNLSMYVIPLLAELDINFKITPWNNFKWLQLVLGDFIMPSNFCQECFK